MTLDVPVLLVIFKRPEMTRLCLEAIGKVRPRRLLVAADGPRDAQEAIQCEATRAVLAEVTWECEIECNFSEENLGCGIRVYTAVDWALSRYDEVIILEDDCIPHPAFFEFCATLLWHYRNDNRIMHISGNNFHNAQTCLSYSYYFSKYTFSSGWATWRRAWSKYDWRLSQWPKFKADGGLVAWCPDPIEQRYWRGIFGSVHGGAKDIWDYQWTASCWMQNGLAILPKVNLVSNIGYGEGATHTKERGPFLGLPVFDLKEMLHPPTVVRDVLAEEVAFNTSYGGADLRRAATWQWRLRQFIRPVLLPLRVLRRIVRAVIG